MTEVIVNVDLDGLDDFERRLKEIEKKRTRVGILNNSPHGSISTAELVELNEREFGRIGINGSYIPPRSTIRLPLEYKEKEIARRGQEALKNLNGQDIDNAYQVLGEVALEAIQEAFDTGGFGMWERNTALTAERKGRDEPMVDEGVLRTKYEYEVVDVNN